MDFGKKIILGSNSPRRREILSGLDIEFTVDTGNVFEESVPADTPLTDIPVLMSEGKSYGFHRPLDEDEVLITSDTMVLLGDRIMGKPHSREDAVDMLRFLSGNTHSVITAVTFRDNRGHRTFRDSTEVTFATLSDEEINYYIDKYKPFDKAGAYGIQEWLGYSKITAINGSFLNVVGFPAHLVYAELQAFIKRNEL